MPDRLTEDEIKRQLRAIFERTEVRVARQDEHDWADLQPGSALVGDDRKTAPLQTSHLVALALTNAVESMHAIKSLVQDASVLHRGVPLILARVAIESAANAAWVLSPARRNERVRRTLILRLIDLTDSDTAISETGLVPRRTVEERRRQINDLAAAAKVGPLPNPRTSTATARIRELAAQADNSFSTLLAWRVGSGFAHGRPWASIAMLPADAEALPTADDGVIRQRTIGSFEAVLWAAGAADLAIAQALRLFKLRGAIRPA